MTNVTVCTYTYVIAAITLTHDANVYRAGSLASKAHQCNSTCVTVVMVMMMMMMMMTITMLYIITITITLDIV